MLAITRQISSYNYSAGNDIKYIVLHDTGNYKDTDEDNATFFCGGDRQSSAHYFIDEDSITQLVEDYNAAWHCGDGHGSYGITNHNSIGIEMCNSGGCIAEATINNTTDLVRSLMQKYNITLDRVVRHYDASRKACPYNMSANSWSKWHEFKSRLVSNNYNSDFIKSIQHDLQRVSCLEGGEINVTGVLDYKTKQAITQFKYVVDLPGGAVIDDTLVNALNIITHKPIIGEGWNSNPIAVKFIQWYLGLPKTGVVDSKMTQAIKSWQIKAGVWSDSGADGVMREVDWNKVLK